MEKGEALEKLAELTARIKELPKGYISKKTIGGKIYYYHQWSENGSKQSRYIKDDEVEPLVKLIDERKELQTRISALKRTPMEKSKRNEVNVLKCILMHVQYLSMMKKYLIGNCRPWHLGLQDT